MKKDNSQKDEKRSNKISNIINSRERLLETIDLDIYFNKQVVERSTSSTYERNKRWYELLLSFQKTVMNAKLIEQLEKGWQYKVEYNDCGAYLYLNYYIKDEDNEEEINPLDVIKSYLLIFERARMLTTKEFSEAYNVEDITVRQWIRKGRIKSAMKTGNGWLIPEFANVELKEYISGYRWERRLMDLPAEYEKLNSYCRLTIERVPDSTEYKVTLYDFKNNSEVETISKQKKEAFELALISNVNVKPFERPMTMFNKSIFK